MVGILVSFWDGLFSGAMLVSGRVTFVNMMPTNSFFPKKSSPGRWAGWSPGHGCTSSLVRTKNIISPWVAWVIDPGKIKMLNAKSWRWMVQMIFQILGSMLMFRGVYIGIRLYYPVMLGWFHKTMTFWDPYQPTRMTHGSCHVRFLNVAQELPPQWRKKQSFPLGVKLSIWTRSVRLVETGSWNFRL